MPSPLLPPPLARPARLLQSVADYTHTQLMLDQAVSWVAEGIDYEPLPLRSRGSGDIDDERVQAVRQRYW